MVPMDAEDTVCQMVEDYSDMLLRLACTRLDSAADAEDVVQEVFLKLLTTRPAFRDAGHAKAWLIRTTLHRACDLRRSAARRNLPLDEAADTALPERDSSIWQAVRGLPEKYCGVVHLHYYEGYSIKEIAKMLGLPAATVGTRLARGRERLRQVLKEEFV